MHLRDSNRQPQPNCKNLEWTNPERERDQDITKITPSRREKER